MQTVLTKSLWVQSWHNLSTFQGPRGGCVVLVGAPGWHLSGFMDILEVESAGLAFEEDSSHKGKWRVKTYHLELQLDSLTVGRMRKKQIEKHI